MLVVFQDYIQDIHLLDEPTNQLVFSWNRISISRWVYEVQFPFHVGPHEPLRENVVQTFPMACSSKNDGNIKCRERLFFSDGTEFFCLSYSSKKSPIMSKLDLSIPQTRICSYVNGSLVTVTHRLDSVAPLSEKVRATHREFFGDAFADIEDRLLVEPNLSREFSRMDELPDEKLWFCLAESPDLVTWQNLASNPSLPMDLTPWASWAAPRHLLENPTYALRVDYLGMDKMMSPLKSVLEEKKDGSEEVAQVEGP